LKISRRLLLLFAGSVLLPGLILAYLSFRSVKDESLLLEKSLEARYLSCVETLGQLLRKTRQANLDQLREQLLPGGTAETPEQAWTLAARLLGNPLVQSLAVFHGDTAVFPRSLAAAADAGNPPAPEIRILTAAVRQDWRHHRYGSCLRSLRVLLAQGGLPASKRFGFRLLEIKCLVRLGETREAAARAREYIGDLRRAGELESYHQIGFYLAETVNLLTSLEDLPRETREELFNLHQRLPLFLSNADFVIREWPAPPEDILRGHIPVPGDSLKAQYHDGVPYLLAGFPWLQRETRVLFRLNEEVFAEAIRSEMLPERRPVDPGWKHVDFAVLNRRDEVVLASDANLSPSANEPALERSLEEEFPAWRVGVYKKPAGELMSLGRRRIGLQYTLLAYSLLALLIGTLTLFRRVA
jgi:hypothetical protein